MAQPAALHGTSAGQRVCAGKKLAAETAPPTAKPPPFDFFEKGLRFSSSNFVRAAPLFRTKKYKSYKNAFISHPSQPSLKPIQEKQRQDDGRLQVRGYSDC